MNRRDPASRRVKEASRREPRARTDNGAQLLLKMFLILGLAAAFLAGRDALAQDDVPEVRNCVDLMRIDHTEVVDNDTILFYMRNGEVFRNDLRHECPTLGFEERFMYRTMLSQLCDVDVITVLQDVGFGFMPTASCGLGKFQPIDEEAAEQLVTSEAQQSNR